MTAELRSRPAIAIAAAPEGEPIKIRGAVRCATPLVAPYTGRPCVYYRLEVLQRGRGRHAQPVPASFASRSGPPWVPITAGAPTGHERSFTASLTDARDFEVVDASGRAEVLVARTSFDVVADFVEIERASHLSKTAQDLAAAHGWTFIDITEVQIREAIVDVGELVDIAGIATREPGREDGGERGFRDPSSTALVFSGPTFAMCRQRDAIFRR